MLFAILQKYDFSSKSQPVILIFFMLFCCLRYCKSTIFQANHNWIELILYSRTVVCDTAKVRFFKQITTIFNEITNDPALFAILQKYDFSSKSQQTKQKSKAQGVVCDTAKVRFFKQITTNGGAYGVQPALFAILQKYDFSSKSQPRFGLSERKLCCLRYCKSTIFQANHNFSFSGCQRPLVVCDTAKVRFFKQITTVMKIFKKILVLFAILQKYDFSSKSQHVLRALVMMLVVCDTAKVRFFKQITTVSPKE